MYYCRYNYFFERKLGMNDSSRNIIARISHNRHNLTATENEIANYIIDHPTETAEKTITVLSKNIGVSEASINRFCKKIGYNGFNDFKIAVAQDSYYRKMQDKKRAASSMNLSETLAFDYTELINITSENINQDLLKELAEQIPSAKNIYIIAFSEAHSVATHLYYQLLMLSIPSIVVNDLNLLNIIVNKCNEDDLFIVITETGNNKELNRLIEKAKQNRSSLFILTSYESSKLSSLSTNKLVIPNRLSINQASIISSYISYIFVIDAVIGILIKSDIKYVREKLENEGIITSNDYHNYDY